MRRLWRWCPPMKLFDLVLGSQEEFSSHHFPCGCGTDSVPIESKPLGQGGPLVGQHGSVEAMGSVIDVSEKTIEFQTFQSAKVPLEVVAGHFTVDLQPKHASALQTQLTPQMWEQVRQGQEATILRPSSEKIGLASSSITHLVATTATPQEDSDYQQTDTAHGLSSGHFACLEFAGTFGTRSLLAISCWRNCFLVEGRNVDPSIHWHTEYGMRMMFRSWSLAVQIWMREVRRVEVSNRQQTNCSGHAVLVQGLGRARDSGTAPISFAGTPPRGGRTSSLAEETAATRLEEVPSRRDQRTAYGTEHLHLWTRRQASGRGGVDPRLVVLVRETARDRNGACAVDVPITPTTGSAQSRVNSRRRRLGTEEDGFMTPTGRRR